MTVKVSSIGLRGLEGYKVQVEVQLSQGTESMVIVGLPDASVKESKERVLSEIRTLNGDVTDQKIVVNLSPPEYRKNGPLFDLAMAVGVLREIEHFKEDIPGDAAFIGALSLDGNVSKVEGMLPALIAANGLGFKRVFLPYYSLIPIDMLEGIKCIVVHHINHVLEYLSGQETFHFLENTSLFERIPEPINEFQRDFSNIIGHDQAKKALEIAAAGGHNVLMSGPPGCGKSMLAETFPSIFPTLTNKAKLEVMSLYQLAKERLPNSQAAPYRHPHHSASSVAIISGGSHPKPGEISLAHHGVLFLDEIAEFTKKTLDMLRQPLETGKVTISRAHSTVTFPASFLLIGAMNPCPWGFLESNTQYCTCTPKQIQSYRSRVSGPVFDRLDILLSLKPVDLDQPSVKKESSLAVNKRVEKARERQYPRYQTEICNARVPFEQLAATSPLTENQQKMITQVSTKQQWSNRVQIKIVRLARTISDLAEETNITDESIWSAITFRRNSPQKQQMKARER